MSSNGRGRRIVPLALGLAMLAVVIAAGLSPNVGLVQAQSNTQYQQSPSSTPGWVLPTIAAIVVIAALALAFVFIRRRRPPAGASPMTAWQGGAPPSSPPAAPPPSPPAAAPAAAVAAPAYLETPEDVGQSPPYVPVTKGAAAAGAGAAAAGAAAEGEPDIDSLMAELDKISGEILKRAPKKGGTPPATTPGDEPPP